MSGLSQFIKVAAGFAVGVQALRLIGQGGFLLRPPGAGDEDGFLAKCIRCGKCVMACPYDVVKAAGDEAGSSVGTPVITPREKACKLCADFPCVAACPTGALQGIEAVSDVSMGVAVIDRDLCISLKGMRCEVCYRTCPLIDEAVTIRTYVREGDSRHAVFEPVIHADKCVGCGICEERCVISDPVVAIRVMANPPYKGDSAP